MPKPRKLENKGLPERWRYTHGAIYYSVPSGFEKQWDGKQTFRLGKTLSEAYRTWAQRVEKSENIRTIGQLLDEYAIRAIPLKAPKTRFENNKQLKILRATFGEMNLDDLEPRDVYTYVNKRTAKTSAKHEIALLSHAYTKAVEWGYISRHPFKGQVRIEGTKASERYVEDWEVFEAISLIPKNKKDPIKQLNAYVAVKGLTGLRKGDMLRLRKVDIKEDGIHVIPNKTKDTTGKRIIIEWSDALRSAMKQAQESSPVDISPYVFPTRRGLCHVDENGNTRAFDNIWRRWMARLVIETKLEKAFTEKDIRAKAGSDQRNVTEAQELLGHSDSRVTSKHYRRKPEIVRPTR